MISVGTPSIGTVRPRMAGSCWKRRRQRRVADEHHRVAARAIFLGKKQPANLRLHTECRQQTGREPRAANAFRIAAPQGDVAPLEPAHRRHGLRPHLPFVEVGRRRIHDRQRVIRRGLPDHRETVRIGIRNRAQQHAIGDREDRRRGADAERERGHGHGRKARPPHHQSKAVPKVLEHAHPPAHIGRERRVQTLIDDARSSIS